MSHKTLVIVPTYGGFDYARRCIESLVLTSPHVDVAVIDDASPDWQPDLFVDLPVAHVIRFDQNDGLTRSWNRGLELARAESYDVAVCGNSDLVFSAGWYDQLIVRGLTGDNVLVGPMTNAPGHAPWQNVRKILPRYQLNDEQAAVDATATQLLKKNQPTRRVRYVNGFCMAAKTADWWRGSFSAEFVFDPRKKMTGNESELQQRWSRKRMRSATVRSAFVFHYRSVSRPHMLTKRVSGGYFRCL